MPDAPTIIIPLPACWHAAWRSHAETCSLQEFPSRTWLEAHAEQAQRFTTWIWRQLAIRNGEVCDRSDSGHQMKCPSTGVSEVIALRILGLLVRNTDPTLHFYLDQKFHRCVAGHPVRRTGNRPWPDPEPSGSPEPLPPKAALASVPRPWVFTNAVALRNPGKKGCGWSGCSP